MTKKMESIKIKPEKNGIKWNLGKNKTDFTGPTDVPYGLAYFGSVNLAF